MAPSKKRQTVSDRFDGGRDVVKEIGIERIQENFEIHTGRRDLVLVSERGRDDHRLRHFDRQLDFHLDGCVAPARTARRTSRRARRPPVTGDAARHRPRSSG